MSLVVVDSATAGTITAQPGNGTGISGVAWAGRPSAQHLYTVGLDNALTSWQLSPTPHDVTLGSTLLADDGDASHLGDRLIGTRGDSVYSMDLGTGTTTSWTFDTATGEQVQGVLPSNDARRAVVSTSLADGAARFLVRDMASGRVLLDHVDPRTHEKNDSLIAAFNADGTQLYAASGRDSIDVLDIATDRVLRSLSIRFPGPGSAGAWAMPMGTDVHGRLLLAVTGSGTPGATNDAGTGLPSTTPPASPADQIALVDPATGEVTASAVVGPVQPFTWEWSSDAARLVIGTSAGTVQVFDATTLAPLSPRVLAHSGEALSASFSPDGSMIVSSGSDGNVAFWDATTMRALGSVVRLGPTSPVWAWYLPDGRVAGQMPATPAGTWPNRLFSMPGTPSAWLSSACAFAGRDLTREEWSRIVTDQPYRPTCP